MNIAIIGSGPSGFYAVGEIFKQKNQNIKIDMFDRLPTPFGLVRAGVAPDHQKIKSVSKIFDRISNNKNFQFFGNVEFGRDITRKELLEYYDGIIYAYGSSLDRKLNIKGEDLKNCHSASEFVGWYNSHPDYFLSNFNFLSNNAVIIGMGNVALDIARILSHRIEDLKYTDISDKALSQLSKSEIKDIWIIGRRGPIQATFTSAEIRELINLPDCEIILEEKSLDLDKFSQKYLLEQASSDIKRNYEILKGIEKKPFENKKKRIHLVFQCTPIEITGSKNKVNGIKLARNKLLLNKNNIIKAKTTKNIFTIDTNLVISSIGFLGKELSNIPFNKITSTISNVDGQLIDKGELCRKEFTTGWIKRGAQGVVGTNKADASQSVRKMFESLKFNNNSNFKTLGKDIKFLLERKKINFVSFDDWKIIDSYEIEAGKLKNKPRQKIGSMSEMLRILNKDT